MPRYLLPGFFFQFFFLFFSLFFPFPADLSTLRASFGTAIGLAFLGRRARPTSYPTIPRSLDLSPELATATTVSVCPLPCADLPAAWFPFPSPLPPRGLVAEFCFSPVRGTEVPNCMRLDPLLSLTTCPLSDLRPLLPRFCLLRPGGGRRRQKRFRGKLTPPSSSSLPSSSSSPSSFVALIAACSGCAGTPDDAGPHPRNSTGVSSLARGHEDASQRLITSPWAHSGLSIACVRVRQRHRRKGVTDFGFVSLAARSSERPNALTIKSPSRRVSIN